MLKTVKKTKQKTNPEGWNLFFFFAAKKIDSIVLHATRPPPSPHPPTPPQRWLKSNILNGYYGSVTIISQLLIPGLQNQERMVLVSVALRHESTVAAVLWCWTHAACGTALGLACCCIRKLTLLKSEPALTDVFSHSPSSVTPTCHALEIDFFVLGKGQSGYCNSVLHPFHLNLIIAPSHRRFVLKEQTRWIRICC